MHQWLDSSPHLTETTRLVNRASLLGICLGLGIFLQDCRCILFTEGGQYPQGTPDYIAQSIWTLHDYDKFNAYTRALQRDLNDSTVAKGYVN